MLSFIVSLTVSTIKAKILAPSLKYGAIYYKPEVKDVYIDMSKKDSCHFKTKMRLMILSKTSISLYIVYIGFICLLDVVNLQMTAILDINFN